jgi:beta-glucosidase
MNWEVYPQSIYNMLHRFHSYPGIPELVITENGAAFPDETVGGLVHDTRRVRYLSDTLTQVLKAKKEGVRVTGHFVWTFMDNFEWAEGYRPRFGLVYVDFRTQQRIVKDSGYWYRDFIRAGLTAPETEAPQVSVASLQRTQLLPAANKPARRGSTA